jgi:DNA gyrase subunit A
LSTDSNEPNDPNEPEDSLPPAGASDSPGDAHADAEENGAETNGEGTNGAGSDGAGVPPPPGRIVELSIEQELKHSYLTYAIGVIVSRALPHVRRHLRSGVLVAMNALDTAGASQ